MMHAKKLIYVTMSSLLTVAVLASGARAEEGYCLALRGNGDAEPAHWGALANLVEKKGLPMAQAGGSSATVSMFLLESIALNDLVSKATPEVQRSRASLLLKSLFGITYYLSAKPQTQAGIWAYKTAGLSRLHLLGIFAKSLASGSIVEDSKVLADLKLLADDLYAFGIGDQSRYLGVLQALKNPLSSRMLNAERLRELAFYSGELYRALSTIGAFNAESDQDLFFRDGIVSFKKLGRAVGRVATFLSGRVSTVESREALRHFVEVCEPVHRGRTWQETVEVEPRCQTELNAALDAFFRQSIDWEKQNAVHAKPGAKIATLATTAVLTGKAYRDAAETYARYHSERDRSLSASFRVENPEDVKFGYWSSSLLLKRVEHNLKTPFVDRSGRRFDFSTDAKSARFLALGEASWLEILSLSPAEPGLASLQPMKIGAGDVFSAGGWSDLHPIPVLKAAGCDQVIYVTRKGGESLFGQGVAKRVFEFERPWDVLRTVPAEAAKANAIINNRGDDKDMTSKWSRLYNLANPSSSLVTSIGAADAVLCTDWNRFDTKNEIREMVTESYQAPYVVSPRASKVLGQELTLRGGALVLDPLTRENGEPSYPGCHGAL